MPAGRAVSSHPPTAKKPELVSESRTAGFFVLGGWFAVALCANQPPLRSEQVFDFAQPVVHRTDVRGHTRNRCHMRACSYVHIHICVYFHMYICAYVHIVKTPNFYYTTSLIVCQAKIFVQFIQNLSHNFVQNFFAIGVAIRRKM